MVWDKKSKNGAIMVKTAIITLFSLLIFSSCCIGSNESEWYDESYLSNLGVADLKQPNLGNGNVESQVYTAYCSEEEYKVYNEYLREYFSKRELYFGYKYELYEFVGNGGIFLMPAKSVFSLTDSFEKVENTYDYVIVWSEEIKQSDELHLYEMVEYNTLNVKYDRVQNKLELRPLSATCDEFVWLFDPNSKAQVWFDRDNLGEMLASDMPVADFSNAQCLYPNFEALCTREEYCEYVNSLINYYNSNNFYYGFKSDIMFFEPVNVYSLKKELPNSNSVFTVVWSENISIYIIQDVISIKCLDDYAAMTVSFKELADRDYGIIKIIFCESRDGSLDVFALPDE